MGVHIQHRFFQWIFPLSVVRQHPRPGRVFAMVSCPANIGDATSFAQLLIGRDCRRRHACHQHPKQIFLLTH